MRAGAQKTAELVVRYPKDPMAHMLRAVYFVDERRFSEAESELRSTITLATQDVAAGAMRVRAQAILGALLADQGRREEAKALAAETCRANSYDAMKRVLIKAKLCD
jgi:predicted negative regulator of RcsB-dependent stress response